MSVTPAGRLPGLIRDALPKDETIGIALSGGGDSTALLHLCLRVGLGVKAVTVDHRLRPESAAEAASVAADCARLGVPHGIRVWDHDEVTGNLMDQARRARIGLIAEWARAEGLRTVALGHTRDDQAETVLIGLSRSAGLAGLSGMRPEWEADGVRFLRPLLGAGRQELRDWLRGEGIGWIDDPTNENDRYTRIRARKVLQALAPLGITAGRLADVAGHLAEAQAALRVQVQAAAHLIQPEAGALRIDPALHREPAEVRRQLVSAAVLWLSGADYAPRADGLERLIAAMAAGRDATLAGCRFHRGWLLREARAIAGPVPLDAVWDGRWRLIGPEMPGAEVRALGAAGLRSCPTWRESGLPRDVLLVTPAVWWEEALLAAPLAGFSATWRAEPVTTFGLF